MRALVLPRKYGKWLACSSKVHPSFDVNKKWYFPFDTFVSLKIFLMKVVRHTSDAGLGSGSPGFSDCHAMVSDLIIRKFPQRCSSADATRSGSEVFSDNFVPMSDSILSAGE